MSPSVISSKAIGVFDSGVGGLTVLNELRRQLPGEDLLYLGDTARVPYGTKSRLSINRYALQAALALIDRGIKLLVVACNTASATAVSQLQLTFPDVPIVGVIEPGAIASCQATATGRIGVIATESTIKNQAYQRAILQLKPDAVIQSHPCSLFVALAEEGWHEGELVEAIVKECLSPLFNADIDPQHHPIDTLVLGCTHFPVLKKPITQVVGPAVELVDSAEMTAQFVRQRLQADKTLNTQQAGRSAFMVTDSPERFSRVAPYFFNESLLPSCIELIDIQHYADRAVISI